MGVLSRSSVQILTRRIVKPSSPTPPTLGCHKLSLLDQMTNNNYIPLYLLFPAIDNTRFTGKDQLFSHMERSLAKVLSYYYPLAGRLVGNVSVNCNDAGVELIQAQINCSLAEILDHTRSPHGGELVLPEKLPWELPTDSMSSLLVAQVTHFDCQGFAISLCMCHKIADAFGLISFIKDWAAIARQPSHVPSPALIGASVFPPDKDHPSAQLVPSSNPVSRRFIFTASKISKLKAMAIQLGVEQPTRVEVVTALLFRCAIVASGSFRPSVLTQAQNLRNVVASLVPENLFGNFSFGNFIFGTNDNNTRFEKIVAQIKNAKAKRGTCCEVLKSDEQLQEYFRMVEGEHGGQKLDHFGCSSMCGFPYYRVDFGCGRPIRVSSCPPPLQNIFMLRDTPDVEGIEAYVTLDKSDMESFERNEELLSFVAPPQKSDMGTVTTLSMPPKLFGKL